jgi:hypothetical protein
MEEADFRDLLTEYLLPMLPGTILRRRSRASTAVHHLVAYARPCDLYLKPTTDAQYRLELHRSQAFTRRERELVGHFVEALSEILGQAEASYFRDLMASVPRQVISRLLPAERGRRVLERAIQRFESLASETYEGKPVVSAFGLTGSIGHGPVQMDDLWKEDFSRVLANGFDSMYVAGSDGRIFNLACLPYPSSVSYAPHRLGSIAAWCDRSQRVALVLNRNGEVLVFNDRRLQFARRRGAWRYYAHDSVISRLGVGRLPLRRAVYESCLDVSFARTGGCIAILTRSGFARLDDALSPSDRIENQDSARAKLLFAAVRAPFQALDRRLRQELLSMDGATILQHTGEVVTAGSIVRVPGGSSSGGRRAAAVQLSKLGLGIKISADGPITGFRSRREIFRL